jgi:predicted phosphodiesterase
MAGRPNQSGIIVKGYLDRFPDTPDLTLAKKIYKENPKQFKDIEAVRSIIRGYTRCLKGYKKSKYYKGDAPLSKSTFNLPESFEESYNAFPILQSKILIISDLHFPYQNNNAIECALQYGLDKDVNCILINGDLFDFANISRHEKDWHHRSVGQEFDAVRQFLKTLRDNFPKVQIIFKHGNHDERWEKWLFTKAPEVFDCKDFELEILLKLGELGVVTVKRKLPIKIGKLTVLHGHEMNGSGGVNPSRATFLKTLESTLVGHSHKTSNHVETTMHGNVISVSSTGCLCGLTPHWNPINKWNLGFAYIEHDIRTGDYVIENKTIIKGKVY